MSEENAAVVRRAGRRAERARHRRLEDAGPDFRLEIERLESIEPDPVLASVRALASGRTTGIDTDLQITNIYDLENGKIRRVRVFRDRDGALEAAVRRE